MAPLQDRWYLETILHLIHGFLYGDSSKFSSTSSSFSRSNMIDTGLSTMLFMSLWSTLAIFDLTRHTNPFSWQYFCMTLHIWQLSLMVFASCKIITSATFKFFSVFVHFFFLEVIARSFFSDTRINSLCVEPVSIYYCCINQVFKKTLKGARLSLISWFKIWWREE